MQAWIFICCHVNICMIITCKSCEGKIMWWFSACILVFSVGGSSSSVNISWWSFTWAWITCFCCSDYHHITFLIVYKPQCSMCVGILFTVVVCSFRATVGRSASDGEVHSVDGSLRSEEGRRSAAQQHRHHAHPALYQLHRPHQQPYSWSVHIWKALFESATEGAPLE